MFLSHVNVSLSTPFPLSKINKNISSGEDLKKKKDKKVTSFQQMQQKSIKQNSISIHDKKKKENLSEK